MSKTLSQKRAEAGRKGGRATVKKHGSKHMSKIGKKGYEVFKRKYRVAPAGSSGWVIVDRVTNKIVNYYNVNRR